MTNLRLHFLLRRSYEYIFVLTKSKHDIDKAKNHYHTFLMLFAACMHSNDKFVHQTFARQCNSCEDLQFNGI
jgi:hypothetical protein